MSLISLLRKGRYVCADQTRPNLREQILDPRTVKVNVSSVMNDLAAVLDKHAGIYPMSELRRIPPVIPPFGTMWLEGHASSTSHPFPVGLLVERESNQKITVTMCMGFQANCVLALACVPVYLDVGGRFEKVTHFSSSLGDVDGRPQILACVVVMLLSLAQMNCRNVTLRPMASGRKDKRIKKPNPGPPATVWHEIVISSAPKTRRTANAEGARGEGGVIRLHRVRGHFEDYSQGKGLFGKIKGVFWIPDYERGDGSAGEVISTYRIEADRTLRSESAARTGADGEVR